MKNNLTLDVHSKVWWLSITSLFLVLIQQILGLFNVTLPAEIPSQITQIINTLLALGGAVGLIYDTTGVKE